MRERDAPAHEILSDLRQVVELAPTAPQEYPPDGESREQRPEPAQMCGHASRPANQPIDQQPHFFLLGVSASRPGGPRCYCTPHPCCEGDAAIKACWTRSTER